MSEMACQWSEWKNQLGPSFCDSPTSRVDITLPSVMEEIPLSAQRVVVPVPPAITRAGSVSCASASCGVHLARAGSVSCTSVICGVHLTRAGSVSCASASCGVHLPCAGSGACASEMAILVLSAQNDFCIFVVFEQLVIFGFDCTLILLSVGSISACLYLHSSIEHTDLP